MPPAGTTPAAATAKPKAKRRGTVSGKPKPLTPRQAEVVQIVGECRGVIAEAARDLQLPQDDCPNLQDCNGQTRQVGCLVH